MEFPRFYKVISRRSSKCANSFYTHCVCQCRFTFDSEIERRKRQEVRQETRSIVEPVRSSPHRFTKVGEGWQTFDPCRIPIVSGITVEHGGPWWTGQLSAPSKRATCVGGSFSGISPPSPCLHVRKNVRIRVF